MNGAPGGVEERMRALQLDYAARLPGKAAEIAARFDALRSHWCPAEAGELRRLVHNLVGSGASYGFPEVSARARAAERALDAALVATGDLAPVGDAVQALVAAAVAARAD